jgi:tachykinin receptor 3
MDEEDLNLDHEQHHHHHHHHPYPNLNEPFSQYFHQDDLPQEEHFISPSSPFTPWLNLTAKILLGSSSSSSLANYKNFNESFISSTMESFSEDYNASLDNGESSLDGDDDIQDYLAVDGGYSILHSLPWWRQMLWCVLFGLMVIVASVGNVTVIWIVLAHKRMRTVTNYLLVNLSIADTMVSTLNVIPNFIFMLTSHWPFGEFYCKLVQFVAVLSICASVFSLMAIAFDR